LGDNLEVLVNTYGKRFKVSTIYFIANQVLNRIKYLHKKSYIHRDIKPENLAIGIGKRVNTVYLFDFGLAKRYINKKTNEHMACRMDIKLTGTICYASVNAHLGIEQSRRDDLESLGFVLIYLAKGSLPWQGLPKQSLKELASATLKKKMGTSIESLCSGLPGKFKEQSIEEFVTYFKYVRSLKFKEEPDYDALRYMFLDKLKEFGGSEFQSDWIRSSLSATEVKVLDCKKFIGKNFVPEVTEGSKRKESNEILIAEESHANEVKVAEKEIRVKPLKEKHSRAPPLAEDDILVSQKQSTDNSIKIDKIPSGNVLQPVHEFTHKHTKDTDTIEIPEEKESDLIVPYSSIKISKTEVTKKLSDGTILKKY
jgi:serine/threonine protein kinase